MLFGPGFQRLRSRGAAQVAVAVATLPARSSTCELMVYVRPLPDRDRE